MDTVKKRPKVDAVVIGAGFAGLSTAWYLSKKGLKKIVVIEHEKKLGGHASGRNAGMIRQAVSDPALANLAVEGRKILGRCGKMGWKGVALKPNGSLLLAKGKEIGELKKTAAILKKEGLHCEWFSRAHAIKQVPLLKDGDFEKGLYCGSDATLDIVPLLNGFHKELRRLGVSVYFGHTLRKIEKEPGYFSVSAGDKVWLSKKVINAAGAWAGAVAQKAKASPVPLKAYRRHLFISKPFRGLDRSWPFVWDLSHNFYFRPQGNALLLSACDKERIKSVEKAVRKETINPSVEKTLEKKLKAFSGGSLKISIQSAKSGLRTMAPDGRFVIGEDPKLKGFFWVAGLGGHGVTTSFSVGNLSSDLILGRKREKFLVDALSPKRFFKKGK